jgi:hypothetical protein
MKAKIVIVISSLFLLFSCEGNGKLSSSLSLSSSIDSSTYSEINSSSISTSAVEVSPFMQMIADRASFYNNGMSVEQIAAKADLNLDCKMTFGNLIRGLKGAFEDFMPKLTGNRKYLGYISLPDEYDGSEQDIKALTWLSSYGLWGEETFFGREKTDLDFTNTMLKRFYLYFGTNPKDDFYAYANHDYLYESTEDADLTSDVPYFNQASTKYNENEKVELGFAKEVVAKNVSMSPIYSKAINYLDGTWNYSFLTDEIAQSEIQRITAISNEKDKPKCCCLAYK